MKYWNLYFLEPYGPPQPCNGTALPLPFIQQCLLYNDDSGNFLATSRSYGYYQTVPA